MRNLVLLVVSLLFSFQIMSQAQVCGVGLINDADINILPGLIENKNILDKGDFEKTNMIRYIPVKFHIISEADGGGQMTFENILDELCNLNNDFADTEFKFYLKDGTVNYLYNDTYYQTPTSSAGLSYLHANRDQDAVNVYVANNASSREDVLVLGVYYTGFDFVIIRKANFASGDHTVTHELGHFFDLEHTFWGWESDPYDASKHGEQVTQINSPGGRPVELVNRSNCNTGGDRICDTAPNYLFGFGYPSSCPEWNRTVLDRNGDTVVPDQNNYMSYFSGCDPYTFSDDQMSLMQIDYNSSNRNYIRSGYVPDDQIITSNVVLYSPAQAATLPYNEVILDWNDVPNVDRYYVQIRGGGELFEYHTDESWFLATELSPNRTYVWKVIPYNETGGCAEDDTGLFRTNTTTSTNELESISQLKIFPNPSINEGIISMTFESDNSEQAVLELISLDGRVIFSENRIISSGYNSISFNPERSSGIYLVRLRTAQGNIVRKLTIL